MACRSGCLTQDHRSWGECARSARLMTIGVQHTRGLERSAEVAKDRELALYRSARAEGIQPATTKTADIEKARRASDKFGVAYNAARPSDVLLPQYGVKAS